ncbi:hypothetical protein BLNAU_22339 [Blattamonas nauphoetae]|uniref:Uncharacterized protein n=1 Tax=Blattamonas nauphoetae TaxID=2049346 RepID=A0ABQ9WTD1_9EUKA|nr:hypothetical protein BLNAU_22339 [Blattamonas nauphoetae]
MFRLKSQLQLPSTASTDGGHSNAHGEENNDDEVVKNEHLDDEVRDATGPENEQAESEHEDLQEEDDVNAEEVEYFEEDQVEDEEIEAEVKTRSFGALT